MKTFATISEKCGAGKTTIGIHATVAAEQRVLRKTLFDLDPQASASSWFDKLAEESDSDAVVIIKDGRLVADWDFGHVRGRSRRCRPPSRSSAWRSAG